MARKEEGEGYGVKSELFGGEGEVTRPTGAVCAAEGRGWVEVKNEGGIVGGVGEMSNGPTGRKNLGRGRKEVGMKQEECLGAP